jgi:hypothetical protein
MDVNSITGFKTLVVTWYSEDHIHLSDFHTRSVRILSNFVKYIESSVRKNRGCSVVYFHNMARFDGILLMSHLLKNHTNYRLYPLMRNNILYQIRVVYNDRHSFIIRDSCKLLTGSLKSLAKDLCPELGSKGDIDHSNIRLDNLLLNKERSYEVYDSGCCFTRWNDAEGTRYNLY